VIICDDDDDCDDERDVNGQHTPGTNKLLKHKDSRKCVKSSNKPGQLLRSSHFPGRPSGVKHLFSPSLP
jgi:hypothetical protein